MSNEPKNPIREILYGFVNTDHLDKKVVEIEGYLRSLVGEKGREEIAKFLCNEVADTYSEIDFNWEQLSDLAKGDFRELADSLAPIIGAQIADGVEKERQNMKILSDDEICYGCQSMENK